MRLTSAEYQLKQSQLLQAQNDPTIDIIYINNVAVGFRPIIQPKQLKGE